MAKRHKKKHTRHVNPYAVLRDPKGISPLELVRLIHKVNPTSEDLAENEKVERYRLKSRLQGLLIEKFGDKLVVEQPDPDNLSLISLRLAHFHEDACHAILDDLDPETRSRIQRYIDVNYASWDEDGTRQLFISDDSTGSDQRTKNLDPQSLDQYSAEELMKIGRVAFEEYDYDTSEKIYRRACNSVYTDPEPARALLELYVDYLASYGKAIEFFNSLSATVKKDDTVRGLYALALARDGQVEQAIEIISDPGAPRGSEIYLIAGHQFIENGDYERASQCHGALVSSELPGLKSELNKLEDKIIWLRSEHIKPMEVTMLEAWEAGEYHEAVRYADELLAQVPENREGLRIKRLFEEYRKNEEIESLLLKADAAREGKEYRREVSLLKRILSMNDGDATITARYKRALESLATQKEETDFAAIREQMASDHIHDALLLYSSLNPDQQARFAEEHEDERFEWLARIMESPAIIKPEKMISAVIALAEARKELARDGDPDTIKSLIISHEKILRPISVAMETLIVADEKARTYEGMKARKLLQEAEKLLRAGDLPPAKSCVDTIDESALDDDERQILKILKQDLRKTEDCRTLKMIYAEREKRGDHFSARNFARKLTEIVVPEEKPEWLDKIREHGEAIKTEWRLSRLDAEDLPVEYRMISSTPGIDQEMAALFETGDRIAYAACFGRWLILFLYDIHEKCREEAIILRLPVPFSYCSVKLSGNTIVCFDESVGMVGLSIEPLDILFWYDFSQFIRKGEIIELSEYLQDHDRLWLSVRIPGTKGSEEIRVIHLDQRRIERQFRLDGVPFVYRHGNELRIADDNFRSNLIKIYSDHGQLIDTLTLSDEYPVHGFIRHPDGNGYIVMFSEDPDIEFSYEPASGEDEDEEEESDCQLFLQSVSDDGALSARVYIEGSIGERNSGLLVSNEHELAVVHYAGENGHFIRVHDTRGEELGTLYEIVATGHFMVATDEFRRSVAALSLHHEGVQAAVLRYEKPRFRKCEENLICDTIPILSSFNLCNKPTGAMNAMVLAYMAQLRYSSQSDYNSMKEKLEKADSPDDIAALIYALERSYRIDAADDLYAWFEEKYPDHPKTRIEKAMKASRNRNWHEVVDLLIDLKLEILNDGWARHAAHILGFGLWEIGAIDKALKLWEEGMSRTDGRCELLPYIEYGDQWIDFLEGLPEAPDQTGTIEVIKLYHRVDEAMSRGEWNTVIAQFEQYGIGSLKDIQLLARFAEAYLKISCDNDRLLLGKISVLAKYIWEYNARSSYSSLMSPAPPYRWSENRLKSIFDSASRWLDSTHFS